MFLCFKLCYTGLLIHSDTDHLPSPPRRILKRITAAFILSIIHMSLIYIVFLKMLIF